MCPGHNENTFTDVSSLVTLFISVQNCTVHAQLTFASEEAISIMKGIKGAEYDFNNDFEIISVD